MASGGCLLYFWLNVNALEFVRVSVIARKFIGVLLGTVNCTIPSPDDVG